MQRCVTGIRNTMQARTSQPLWCALCSCVLAACLLGVALSGCNTLRGYATGRSESMALIESQQLNALQRGELRFILDDLNGLNTDTLETNGLPWKIAVAALILDEGINRGQTTF